MPISAFTDISGCKCVLDSTLGAYTDLGTTAATSNGDIIEQWNDQSGNGNHWTNSGASGSRPVWQTDAQQNAKVMTFDGTIPQFINGPNFLSGLTAATWFVVFRLNNRPPAGNQTTGFHDMSTGGGNNAHLTFTDNGVYENFGSSTTRTVYTLTRDGRNWTLHHAFAGTNDLRSGADGYEKGGVATTSTFGFRTTPIFGKNNLGWGFDGAVRLLVFYDSLLTRSQFEDVVIFTEDNYAHYPDLEFKAIHQPPVVQTDIIGGEPEWVSALHPYGEHGGGGQTASPIVF